MAPTLRRVPVAVKMKKLEFSFPWFAFSMLIFGAAIEAQVFLKEAFDAWSLGREPLEAGLRMYRLHPLGGGSAAVGAFMQLEFTALLLFVPALVAFVVALRWINRTFDPAYTRCIAAAATTAPALVAAFYFLAYAWMALTGYKVLAHPPDLAALVRGAILFGIAAVAQMVFYRAIVGLRHLGDFVR